MSVPPGAEHGGDPDATGVRVLRAAAGAGEGQRVLRVHTATHRPLRHAGLRQVRRDRGELIIPIGDHLWPSTHGKNTVSYRCQRKLLSKLFLLCFFFFY